MSKKSNIGMNFTGTEIIKIIEVSGKNGVSKFSFGELEIVFGGVEVYPEVVMPERVEDAPEEEGQDFDLQNLIVEDPVGYEETLINEQLEEDHGR